MPANYAHYRFGKQLIPTLPADARQCIQRFRRLFDVGLHGPDIFFYYNPFLKTATGALGSTYHMQTGQELFPKACAAAGSEAARAYLYGLLGHYCLDALCHPYIQQLVDIGEARHSPLEAEFDRYLMVKDGIPSPHTYELSNRLKLTRGECMTVSAFYPPATGAAISQCLKNMIFFTKFMVGPNRKTREKLLMAVKPSVCDHFIPLAEVEELALYVRELDALFQEALAQYPLLLEQLQAHMRTGEPLGEAFARDFG